MTGVPLALVNMRTGEARNYPWAPGGASILSDLGSLTMEFSYLSDITGDPVYRCVHVCTQCTGVYRCREVKLILLYTVREKVMRLLRTVRETRRPGRLYPHFLEPNSGQWRGEGAYSLGAFADSFYEYLLKEWLRSGGTDLQSWTMFSEAASAVLEELVHRTKGGLTYLARVSGSSVSSSMEHLACFAGGMFGLAGGDWISLGENITRYSQLSYNLSYLLSTVK